MPSVPSQEETLAAMHGQIQNLKGDLDANVKLLQESLGQLHKELEVRIELQFQRLLTMLPPNRKGHGDDVSGCQYTGDQGGGFRDRHTPKPKLEAPMCDGSEPLCWLYKADEYFKFYTTPPEERLRCIALMLEGPAADWFRWRMNANLIVDYADFVDKFKLRFDPMYYADYFGQLANLRQTGSVMEYQTAFENIMQHVTGASEANLLSLFHAGLKPHLRHEIALLKPTTLSSSFALARELEAKHSTLLQSVSPRQQSWNSSLPPRVFPTSTRPSTQEDKAATPTPVGDVGGSAPVRRLPRAERLERRAKGLCYNCDQKWSKTHRCGRFLLLCDDDDEELPEDSATDIPPITADICSLNTMDGAPAPRSLRLAGRIHQTDIQVLIDGGSTHNFLHPDLVSKLQLPVFMVTPFRVYVGNGDSLPCDKRCAELPLFLQGTLFSVDVFVLPIHGQDVVLGVQWLQQLGRVTHDYASMKMEFTWRDKLVSLQGGISAPQGINAHTLNLLHGRQEFADALSRRDDGLGESSLLHFVSYPVPALMDTIRPENQAAPDLLALHNAHAEAGESKVPEVDALLTERDSLLHQLRRNLEAAQRRMKAAADKHRRDLSFEVGDWVLLRLEPYQQHSVARRPSAKLSRHFYGPFEVEEKIGPVAYRLKLPPTARIHPVFHVSRLRRFYGQPTGPSYPLPTTFIDGQPFSQPVRIHQRRFILQQGHTVEQLLVEWSDGNLDDATWNPRTLFGVVFQLWTLRARSPRTLEDPPQPIRACWSFSATGAIEGINQIVTGSLVSLSEQELIDCDKSYNSGCDGGLMDYAYKFVLKNNGIDTEEDYPYQGAQNTCNQAKLKRHIVSIDGYKDVPSNNEKQLLKAVASQPVSVGICGSERAFQLYSKGIFDGPCSTNLDHAVLIVGYGSENGVEYWIIKNSWGTSWGMKGYMHMQRNTGIPEGMCGVNMLASYPTKTTPNPPGPRPGPTRCSVFAYCGSGETCCCVWKVFGICLSWKCCGAPAESASSAVCCKDGKHCCPGDYPICDSTNNLCLKKSGNGTLVALQDEKEKDGSYYPS
ncbi:unnamed protein product [Cuscuta campestris]|uniref:Peptidase C1A papain C-terminal domain-containing protein n=1 Tax=Cuscuta campestris TaxID=132261 RepID=A0A484L0P5_9ASTE|nr:unnamed protein product [Cuscuta campestris]